MLRLTRLEVGLFAALALCWGARAAFIPPAASETAWRQQETQTQQQVQQAIRKDPAALESRLREDPSLMLRFQGLLLLVSFLGLVSFYQWGRFVVRGLMKAPSTPILGSPAPPAWGGRQVFRLVLGLLLAIQFSVLIQAALYRFLRPDWLDRRVGAMIDTLWVDLLAIAVVAWFLRRRPAGQPASPPRAVLEAFRRYAMAIPLFLLLMIAVAFVLDRLGIQPPPQPVLTMYLSEQRTAVVKTLLFLAVLTGPVAEELFFRGFLYGWLRVRIGVVKGLAFSSVLFSMLHMDPVAFLPLTGLGILFGLVYERTGSLAAPIAIHVFHNGMMLLAASVIKGLMAA